MQRRESSKSLPSFLSFDIVACYEQPVHLRPGTLVPTVSGDAQVLLRAVAAYSRSIRCQDWHSLVFRLISAISVIYPNERLKPLRSYVAAAWLAGQYVSILFGLGLLASAVLALPVLAATSAYVMAKAFGWRRSLDAGFSHARRFYLALVLSFVAALGITLMGIGPIQLLFVSSIVGGLGTPGTLLFLMRLARDRTVMGEHRIGRRLAVAGWAVTLVVACACALFLWQTFL